MIRDQLAKVTIEAKDVAGNATAKDRKPALRRVGWWAPSWELVSYQDRH